ncbi:E3 ubiquitin-protein ligase TRIM45 isoform X2 [Lycorma delicatula]|uniref:E3 ubiquitin-protein ligase TRIM45 isoform X2 n=1 Tax=Lycorma delicatula TaxID=130591 RepID=UPI003F50DB91
MFKNNSLRQQLEDREGSPKRQSTESIATESSTVASVRLRRPKLQLTIGDASLKCRICKRAVVEPRILPCLHTFCTKCLLPLIKRKIKEVQNQNVNGTHSQDSNNWIGPRKDSCEFGNHLHRSRSCSSCYENDITNHPTEKVMQHIQVIKCPVCEAENNLSEDEIIDLPLNYIIQNRMLTALQQSAICNLCKGDVPASMICQDCLITMCLFCSELHVQEKENLLHEIISLQEIVPENTFTHKQVMCKAHFKRELRLFCTLCNSLVCRDCCMEQHHTHPCETAAKAARQYKNTLKEALTKSQPLAKETVLGLSRLQNLQHRILMRCSEVEKEVQMFAVSYKSAVEEHCQVLMREVAQVRENKLSALKSYEQLIHLRSEQTSQAVNFSQDVLTEASDIEFLSIVDFLLNRLKWCQETPPVPVTKVSDCLIFLSEERAGVINNHQMYGVVTTQSVSPYHCTLETEGLLNCRQYKKAEFLLKTCDSEGQQVCHGGEKVNAELNYIDAPQRQVPMKVLDRGDGTYLLVFTPDAPGNLSLSVTVQQKSIQRSPFNVSVSTQRPHPGIYHCCAFCSSNGNKNTSCACGGTMPDILGFD